MPYCSRCGVEVNDEARKCPLCQSPIQRFYDDPAPGREFPEDALGSAAPRLSSKEKIRVAVSLVTFGMMIPLFITIAADVMINRRISWSMYPIVSLVSSWFLTVVPLIYRKRPYRIIWGNFLVLCAGLWGLYRFCRVPVGVMSIGGPIVFSAAVITHGILFLSLRTSRRGANIAALILLGIGLFCGSMDLILTYKLHHFFRMSWSLIVLGAILPVSSMLFYLHYRKKQRRTGFSRFFHT